jgi:putative nucleotidyltransferase with HDIG domain
MDHRKHPSWVYSQRDKSAHLKALLKISQEVTSTLDFKEVLVRIRNQALKLLKAEICSVLLFNEQSGGLRIVTAQGLDRSVCATTMIPIGEGISGWVAKYQKSLFIKDIKKSRFFNKATQEKYYTHSLISCPLISKKKLLGVINVNNKRSRKPFTSYDLELLEGLASLAAIALHNATLHEDLQTVHQEVTGAFISTLWAKDPYTKEHSESITDLALAMARQLGLQEGGLKMVHQACHLHDIGKIGIRDAILQKSEKLTADEWKEMKLHPLIGAKILRTLSFMKEVADIVEQEHERWDGRGYPFKLKEGEIHIGARIVAVADAYDAMTSDRPYHKADSHELAVEEINRCKGTQFDPKVVDAFNYALKKGIPGITRSHPSVGKESGKDPERLSA